MFSVLTFNLRFGLADDGPNRWELRKSSIESLLRQHPADFIAFQEVNDFQLDFVSEILKGWSFIGRRSPAPPFWQNNILFYKKAWECRYRAHFFLSPTPSLPSRFRNSRWPRQCTIGTFNHNDHKLICINTHLDFDPGVRIKSARLIMQRLSLLSADIPAILLGDFNATPTDTCHDIFTGQHEAAAIKGPFFRNAFNKTFPGTHHGFTGKRNGGHIDWILYRGKITPKDTLVVRDAYKGRYPSDHFPVSAAFTWGD